MKAFEYARATTEAGIFEALERGYQLKASGIDVLDLLKERTAAPEKLVHISGVESLAGITQDENGAIVIGALATLNDMVQSKLIGDSVPLLADSVRHAATPQVRAVATVGGNICQRPRCWYFRSAEHRCLKKGGAQCFAVEGDNTYHALFGRGPCHIVHPSNIAPPLLALDADIIVRNGDGERIIKATDFFSMPDKGIFVENVLEENDLVAAVRINKPAEKSGYAEVREKQSFDWPLATCSAARLDGKWRVVLGAVAPVPWVAEKAQKTLGDVASITPELARKVAADALDGAEPMSQNEWRTQLIRAVVRRALLIADGKEID